MGVGNLVHLDQARRAPGDLLERLRAIDPQADLVYLGPGQTGDRWCLGVVRPNQLRRRAAEFVIGSQRRFLGGQAQREDLLVRGHLGRQGFALIAIYEFRGEPDARIVQDFERRTWLWRHTTDSEMERRIVDMDRERELWDDEQEYRTRHEWRFHRGMRHSVTNVGLSN